MHLSVVTELKNTISLQRCLYQGFSLYGGRLKQFQVDPDVPNTNNIPSEMLNIMV